jgi:SET domain-containing protein
MRSAEIGVRRIAGKGRGLFALAPFEAGAVLEVSSAIALGKADTEAITRTALDDYNFAHPADPDGCLIVLGHATLCNHSDDPNAETVTPHDPDIGWIVELRTLRRIAPGEEITRRYACDLWFKPTP